MAILLIQPIFVRLSNWTQFKSSQPSLFSKVALTNKNFAVRCRFCFTPIPCAPLPKSIYYQTEQRCQPKRSLTATSRRRGSDNELRNNYRCFIFSTVESTVSAFVTFLKTTIECINTIIPTCAVKAIAAVAGRARTGETSGEVSAVAIGAAIVCLPVGALINVRALPPIASVTLVARTLVGARRVHAACLLVTEAT